MVSRYVPSPRSVTARAKEGCRYGVVSYADSLDCVGVLARNVEDTRAVFGESVSVRRVGGADAA